MAKTWWPEINLSGCLDPPPWRPFRHPSLRLPFASFFLRPVSLCSLVPLTRLITTIINIVFEGDALVMNGCSAVAIVHVVFRIELGELAIIFRSIIIGSVCLNS